MSGRMARCVPESDLAGQLLPLLSKFKCFQFFEGGNEQIVIIIGTTGPYCRILERLPIRLMDEVTSVWERQLRAIPQALNVPADMVRIEMSKHDQIDIFRPHANRAQLL